MAVLPTVEVPDRLAAAVRRLVADRGTTYAALVREALRREVSEGMDVVDLRDVLRALLERLDALLAPPVAVCTVCQTPRRTDDPNPLADAMAHAQCDQIVATLDRQVST